MNPLCRRPIAEPEIVLEGEEEEEEEEEERERVIHRILPSSSER